MGDDSYAASQAADNPQANATDRLARINGVGELQAAILALMVPRDSKRAARAWQIETKAAAGVEPLLAHARKLSGAARLPWFERLIERMARHPIEARQSLLRAARRLMGARGVVRPIDRLHWLVLRRGFGEVAREPVRAEANVEVTEWLESDVLALGDFTAFLARIIPEESDGSAGRSWYVGVMSTWQPYEAEMRQDPVDSEEMVVALKRLQTLSWMQRPIVIRSWVTAALKASGGVRLSDSSADALRMTCQLLDSPLPPELVRHYIEIPPDPL